MSRTVAALGEIGLIQRAARHLGAPRREVRVGIGDDAAVLPWTRDAYLLFASDMLVEGVHFTLQRGQTPSPHDRGQTPARWIGWKALACNVSDIAAMGGMPTYAVVSLGVPPSTPVRVTDGLAQGLARCARRFGVAVVGGDTVRAPQLVIDVAILGTVPVKHLVLRSGAKPGDVVFVTGRLGGSLVSGRHATFMPRVVQAQWLVRHVPVHAMMDLSDGLASDLWQLARASRVTIDIEERAIPVSRAARSVQHALMDGEDYELLFAVPAQAANKVPRSIGRVPVTPIGLVTARGTNVRLATVGGRMIRMAPHGFKHF